jgi:hypothetical protein
MPLFAVVAKTNAEAVRQKAKEQFGDSLYELKPDTWIIDANTTSADLADKLGIRNDPSVGSGLVVAMSGYSGRAETDLWEWLKVHWPKAAT